MGIDGYSARTKPAKASRNRGRSVGRSCSRSRSLSPARGRARSPGYAPLMGFTGPQYRCPRSLEGAPGPGARLRRPPPPALLRKWNSLQLLLNLAAHDPVLLPRAPAKPRDPAPAVHLPALAALFGASPAALRALARHCPGAVRLARALGGAPRPARPLRKND